MKSAEELRTAFALPEGAYQGYNPFTDGKPGFSIQRAYPADIPFVPPVKKDGTPDTVAMIRVLYNPGKLPQEKLDPARVPLWIDVGPHSEYRYRHFGYDFEQEDCPTAESLERSRSTPQPVHLEFLDDFFFSHKDSLFIERDSKFTGAEIFEHVFRQHCETTSEKRRRKWRRIARIGVLAHGCIGFLEWVLRWLFGKQFNYKDWPQDLYRKEDIGLLEQAKSLEIFGYRTTKNVIVTYSVIVLIGYTVFYLSGLVEWPLLKSLGKSPVLHVLLNIVLLVLFEHLGPHVIRVLVNVCRRVRWWGMRSPLCSEDMVKSILRDEGKKKRDGQTGK